MVAEEPKVEEENVMDGATASAYVAYICSDAAFIYPITPSSLMSETFEAYTNEKRLNAFGQVSEVRQLQSEAGAAGAVHGSLCVGSLTTTFTASQGLLLMIPAMYKIAGELQPTVFHISARAVAGQALSIFGDHSDVMAARQAGWTMISGMSVQEAMDLALISHMTTLLSRVPIMHFFDGFRTSHELQKIKVLTLEFISSMLPMEAIQKFRERALNPTNPYIRGTSQGPEIFFQNQELCNRFYDAVPGIVEDCMEKFAQKTGRRYSLFDYFGSDKAEHCIVMMGSGAPVVMEVMDIVNRDPARPKVGLVVVRLYRPWRLDKFLDKVPTSVKRIAVLDRTKESGSLGEPLFLDVTSSFLMKQERRDIHVVGGRYGLGSRDFTPSMAMSVFDNLMRERPQHPFTVGIHDDVTHLSLPYRHLDIVGVPEGTKECLFWGMGSDGTVGANKNVIKIIGMNTPLFVQAYFSYSAYKAGGLTLSHLRFGPKPITSQYLIQTASYVAVHRQQYAQTFDVLGTIAESGIFVLNCQWTDEELEDELPNRLKRQIAQKKIRLFTIDANKVAAEVGMGRRINNVLMTIFFKLSGVLPFEEAIGLFKDAIKKTYGKKGHAVVEANWRAVDVTLERFHEVFVDRERWANLPVDRVLEKESLKERKFGTDDFANSVLSALTRMEGDDLPVSAFLGYEGGVLPMGTADYEKRAIALSVPIVDMDKCIQCNYCSFVCPHAAIRPFLLDDDEAARAPSDFDSRKTKGIAELAGFKYRIQVSPFDCTGCELCSVACPTGALTMTPLPSVQAQESPMWNFAVKLPDRGHLLPNSQRMTLKGSQFYKPLLEFSGACEGCGETPYVKLLTQLFGERMIIANATGCTSIWGASYPSVPYTVNDQGYGPAWGNSLFEDNAEYGFGMVVSMDHRRRRLHSAVQNALRSAEVVAVANPEVMKSLATWLEGWQIADVCGRAYEELKNVLESERSKHKLLSLVADEKDLLPKISIWMIGGDGWAYDIGYGGLDHVMASGINVNCLVLDTEVYSNTGGQTSKATVRGAVHKFASSGRTRNKKDLGALMMEYQDVYVASVASSANMSQTVKSFIEAEQYIGPALIVAYSPCIEHNYIKPFSRQIEHCTLAVESGYWPLYRYNPALADKGENPFILDCKKLKSEISLLLEKENRFKALSRIHPEAAAAAERDLKQWAVSRFKRMKQRVDNFELEKSGGEVKKDSKKYFVLYGSETGNAEDVANRLGKLLKTRGLPIVVSGLDAVDVDEVSEMQQVLFVCSTAGQGEMPVNSHDFWDALSKEDLPSDKMAEVSYAVFGLCDSSYVFFNEAARKIDQRMHQLGGRRLLAMGVGDDQHEDKYDTSLCEWFPEYLVEIKAPEPTNVSESPDSSMYTVETLSCRPGSGYVQCVPAGAKLITLDVSRRMTPEDYEVEVRHLEFDLSGTGIKYNLGDSLAVYPTNCPHQVDEFCKEMAYCGDDWVVLKRDSNADESIKHECLFKAPMTVRQLLTECLDVFGKPSRSFYENLWKYCTNKDEKTTAKTILDQSNRETYVLWLTKENVTYASMFKKFPSAKPTLAQLIDLVSLVKCRYYSIASAQRYVGTNRLHLCVGIVDWRSSTGEQRFGQCTGMFHRLARRTDTTSEIRIAGTIKATAFNLPPTDMHPIIVAGMGTGLAPFRAFLQNRAWLKDSGKPIGPVVVYFGCRYSKKDYLYGEELEKFHRDGVVTELCVAFSRDQKEKFYVQHHISRNPELFCRRFLKEDGFFYLCGSAKQVPIDVRAAVVDAISRETSVTEEQAATLVTDLQIKGRYNLEAW